MSKNNRTGIDKLAGGVPLEDLKLPSEGDVTCTTSCECLQASLVSFNRGAMGSGKAIKFVFLPDPLVERPANLEVIVTIKINNEDAGVVLVSFVVSP